MRKVAVLALALMAVTACELLLPIDRSLIPDDAGADSSSDGSTSEGDDAAEVDEVEESSTTADTFVAPAEAGDAAVVLDAPGDAEGSATGDGSTDAPASGDAGADSGVGDANDGGALD
jgi:hypothetical protein